MGNCGYFLILASIAVKAIFCIVLESDQTNEFLLFLHTLLV